MLGTLFWNIYLNRRQSKLLLLPVSSLTFVFMLHKLSDSATWEGCLASLHLSLSLFPSRSFRKSWTERKHFCEYRSSHWSIVQILHRCAFINIRTIISVISLTISRAALSLQLLFRWRNYMTVWSCSQDVVFRFHNLPNVHKTAKWTSSRILEADTCSHPRLN